MWASICDRNPLMPGSPAQGRTASPNDFTWSADSLGRLSLTVHNDSDQSLYGLFGLQLDAGHTFPIPEPATWALMGCGLAFVASRVRHGAGRRREAH